MFIATTMSCSLAVAPFGILLGGGGSVQSANAGRELRSTAAQAAHSIMRVIMVFLRFESALCENFRDRREQPVRIERLDEPAGRARGLALELSLGGGLGREHEEWNSPVARQVAQVTHERESVHHGHVHVRDDEIEPLALGDCE